MDGSPPAGRQAIQPTIIYAWYALVFYGMNRARRNAPTLAAEGAAGRIVGRGVRSVAILGPPAGLTCMRRYAVEGPPAQRPDERRWEAMRTTVAHRKDGLQSSEFVYRSLKEQIISGTLAPDSRLIELTIAAEFGVSRTPVREALKRLAVENLVHADPARGIIVHAPDARKIEDVFVVREALDGLASRLAAHRITPSELARLQVVVESMEEAIHAGRREHVVVANTHFHDVIYAAAGNEVLERLGRDLREFVRRFTTLPFASPDRVDQVLSEHRAIVRALERHDPDAAEAASNAHLAAARENVVRMQLREFAEKTLG